MIPEFDGENQRSVVVEPFSCAGAEYWEPLPAQKNCGLTVNWSADEFPKLVKLKLGATGFPSPTSEYSTETLN